MMKLKSTITILIILVVLSALGYLTNQRGIDTTLVNTPQSVSNESVKDITKINEDIIKEKDATEIERVDSKIYTPTQQDIIEYVRWEGERGYLDWTFEGKQVPLDYHTFSSQTLLEMVKSGDKKAMLFLSERLMNDGKYIYAEPMLHQASIRGYTKTIIELGNTQLVKYKTDNSKGIEDVLEALAWYKVAVTRGDLNAIINYRITSRQYELNESELAFVNKRSDELYSSLVEKRAYLGLEKFDNSIPVFLEKTIKSRLSN